MTETPRLSDLFDRATDAIESPDLVAGALRVAGRRRTRRRGVVAAAASSALVVAVVITTNLGGDAAVAPPSNDPSSTQPDPSPPRSEDPDRVQRPMDGAPPIDRAVIQPLWDPRTVGDLPWDDATSLPRSLDPTPTGSFDLSDVSPVLAMVDTGERLFLWHTSGVRQDRAYPEAPYAEGRGTALSPDGTWLAFAGRTGIWTSVQQGAWRRHDYPAGFRTAPDFGVQLRVADDGSVVLEQYGRSWYDDLRGGGAIRLERSPYDLVVAPDGRAIGLTFDGGVRGVLEYDDGRLVSDSEAVLLQSLNRPAASGTSLAAVRGVGSWSNPRAPEEQNGLIALERGSLVTRAYLPIRDPHHAHTDGGDMAALGWLDDDTVLASVVAEGGSTGTRTLFSWDVVTGDLRKVSELPASFTLSVASALPG